MTTTREKVGRNVCFKVGILPVVVEGGEVKPGGAIRLELLPEPHEPLKPL